MKLFFLLLFSVASCQAADEAVNSASGNLLQVTLSLVLVLGLIIAISMGFKKFGINRMQSNLPVSVIGAVSIGNHQRLMVIEVGEEWIVLGVTPQNISTIPSLPRQSAEVTVTDITKPNFATWMQSTLEKYHAKKN